MVDSYKQFLVISIILKIWMIKNKYKSEYRRQEMIISFQMGQEIAFFSTFTF